MYETIIFLQGDDYAEFEAEMHEATGADWVGTREWVDAAFGYLGQWDYGESTGDACEQPWGGGDDVYEIEGGQFVISHHEGLSYVSLSRRVDEGE